MYSTASTKQTYTHTYTHTRAPQGTEKAWENDKEDDPQMSHARLPGRRGSGPSDLAVSLWRIEEHKSGESSTRSALRKVQECKCKGVQTRGREACGNDPSIAVGSRRTRQAGWWRLAKANDKDGVAQ
mmetsp:Transcript_29729/g.64318  ORF Transcript_29729/g.64318 Transcript_29729/m.64318 type:complete len:127 (-) Transcript_29729:848-1228(-)